MKRLLLYLVVAIVVVCCGVSIYYVVRNDEKIYATQSEAESVYLNVDETIDIPVVHEKPNQNTTLEVIISSDIAKIDTENWTITAKSAGETRVTITSSNKKFGPFNVLLKIGNGSVEFPYYIRNEADLQSIGVGKRSLTSNYQLVEDIELSENFSPIGSREAPFNGTLSGILYGSEVKRLSISNLEIDETLSEDGSPVGLFRVIGENGKVENIIFKNANVKANASVAGVVAGKNYGIIGKCEILDSKVTNIKQENAYTGIVCGLNETKSSYARISLNTVKGSIESNYIAGGLAGFNKGGVITNNHVEIYDASVVVAENSKGLFGGIAGQSNDGSVAPYQSVVFNNLVLINNLKSQNTYNGGVFGIIEANANYGKERRGYYSMLMYNSPLRLSPVGYDLSVVEEINKQLNKEEMIYLNEVELSSDKQSARNYSASITNAEVNTKSTYVPKGFMSSWDFTNIWSISNGKEICINYENENLDYQSLPALGTVIEITDNKSLANAISNMVNYPTAKITYLIKGKSEQVEVKDENGNTVLDENGEAVVQTIEKKYSYAANAWTPIGTKEAPFAGTIIAEDDAIIEIKKLSVSGREFAGLFGAISSDAVISNVWVTGANISGTMVGGIAAYQNGGVIKNCAVKNSKLTSTKYAGAICGFSTGTIDNCYGEKNKIYVTEDKELNIYLGGIVAKSKGKVISSSVNNFDIEVNEIVGKDNTICMGGIAGLVQSASVSQSFAVGINFSSYEFKGRSYAGGVIGYAIDSNIKKVGIIVDENKSNIIELNDSNAYSNVGGLVGLLDGGKLSKSSTGSAMISAYNAAGLVSFVNGEIEECYSGTTAIIKGKNVAGLACHHYGTISNSYSLSELYGSEIEAGLVTYLWKGSKISNCYTYCSFKGTGDAYADTSSNYKSRSKDFGSIENSLFVGNNNQTIAKKGIKDFYKESIVCRDGSKKAEVQITYILVASKYNFITEDGLIGKDGYAMFEKLKFNSKQWAYDTAITENFVSPTLVDCFDSEFGIIEEQKEEAVQNEETVQNEEIAA